MLRHITSSLKWGVDRCLTSLTCTVLPLQHAVVARQTCWEADVQGVGLRATHGGRNSRLPCTRQPQDSLLQTLHGGVYLAR